MDLRKLRTFMQVTELGSLTVAAERLHIAQPALSRQIRLLEEEFGAPLFDRNGRGMALTEMGSLLYGRIGPLLRQLEEVRAEVADRKTRVEGRVVIGMPPSCSEAFGCVLVQRFTRHYPEASLAVIAGLSGHLFEWLQRQEIDGAFLYEAPHTENFAITSLATEALCLIGRADAARWEGDTVDFAVAATQKLVLTGRKHGLRLLLESAAQALGHKLDVRVEIDALRLQLDLVTAAPLFTITAASAVRSGPDPGRLRAWTIASPALVRNLVFATPSGVKLSPALRAFTDEARALVTSAYLRDPGPISPLDN